jgi:hypothetical protein
VSAPAREVRNTGGTVTVRLWRDHDPVVRLVPGVAMGERRITADWAEVAVELYRQGARYARIAEPVELCATGPAGPLILLRELTARGLAVDWTARCADGCDADLLLRHLWPPSTVDGTEAAGEWARTFFPCKCVYRHGPGFVEVRDRRFGSLELFTIDEPEHLAAIGALAGGAPNGAVPAAVRAELGAARLLGEHRGLLWWLPARVYRWPFPPLLV